MSLLMICVQHLASYEDIQSCECFNCQVLPLVEKSEASKELKEM